MPERLSFPPSPRRRPTAVALALALAAGPALAAPADDPVALVGGRAITRAELEAALAPQLAQLEAQRARLLEDGLARLVDDRLITLEAERLGVDVAAFVRERIDGAVAPVTDTEVAAWYQANQARVRQPLERVQGAIRDHLAGEARGAVHARLVAELRTRYPVERRLEPHRVALDNGNAPVRGPAGAPVELTIFSDFECPWCKRIVPTLEELQGRFPETLRVVFRHLPLTSLHPRAEAAALAAVCAAEQDRFWPLHDRLFAGGAGLDEAGLASAAAAAALDLPAWTTCRESPRARDLLRGDVEAASRLGVAGTPAIFVNGRPVDLVAGRPPLDVLAAVVAEELDPVAR